MEMILTNTNNDDMSERGAVSTTSNSGSAIRLHSKCKGHHLRKLKTTNIHKKSQRMLRLKQNNINKTS